MCVFTFLFTVLAVVVIVVLKVVKAVEVVVAAFFSIKGYYDYC